MDTAWLIAVASIVSALVTAGLMYLGVRRTAGLGDLQARYDQMQEDVDRERSARLTAEHSFRAEITGLRIEMVALRAEVRVRDDYIGSLRRHINDRGSPPPPPYPAALTGQVREGS